MNYKQLLYLEWFHIKAAFLSKIRDFLFIKSVIFLLCYGTKALYGQDLQLIIGPNKIRVELANTELLRRQGLMHRKSLPENAGMLFVFPYKDNYCFWMKNTLIHLSIAFINDDGVIINILEMSPGANANYCASAPALYALEMNHGWFKHKDIFPGQKISGLNTVDAK